MSDLCLEHVAQRVCMLSPECINKKIYIIYFCRGDSFF